MNKRRIRAVRLGLALCLLMTAKCSKNNDISSTNIDSHDVTVVQETRQVVGKAGAHVETSDGAALDLPPGALTQDVTVGIGRVADMNQLPALPGGVQPRSDGFAFTPHGLTFALDVTVTLPLHAGAATDGLAIYRAEPGSGWQQLAILDSTPLRVQARTSTFSYFVVGATIDDAGVAANDAQADVVANDAEADAGGKSDARADADAGDPDSGVATACSSGMFVGALPTSVTHRAGEACGSGLCHNGTDAPIHVISGTVYPTANEVDDCAGVAAGAATVVITDCNSGQIASLATNPVGNFLGNVALPAVWCAEVQGNGKTRKMAMQATTADSGAGVDMGNCNGCHTASDLDGGPGRVVIPAP